MARRWQAIRRPTCARRLARGGLARAGEGRSAAGPGPAGPMDDGKTPAGVLREAKRRPRRGGRVALPPLANGSGTPWASRPALCPSQDELRGTMAALSMAPARTVERETGSGDAELVAVQLKTAIRTTRPLRNYLRSARTDSLTAEYRRSIVEWMYTVSRAARDCAACDARNATKRSLQGAMLPEWASRLPPPTAAPRRVSWRPPGPAQASGLPQRSRPGRASAPSPASCRAGKSETRAGLAD